MTLLFQPRTTSWVLMSLLLHATSVFSVDGVSSRRRFDSIHGVRGTRPSIEAGDDTNRRINNVDETPSAFHGAVTRTKKNSGSSIESLFEDCATTCDSSRRTLASSTDKPSCCGGGISALKMIYHGPTGNLATSGGSLTAPVNSCNSQRRSGESQQNSVRFADCARCFPASNDECDVGIDTMTMMFVTSGTEVCLVLVDLETNRLLPEDKFPTNTDIFFGSATDGNVVLTTIHTSCSNPIYPPFGVRIGPCVDDDDYLVDLSVTAIGDDEAVFEFVDGASRKDPDSLFSDCSSATKTSSSSSSFKDETCCRGGASFVKARLLGDTIGGFLTINPSKLSSVEDCDDNDSGYRNSYYTHRKKSGKKSGKKSHTHSSSSSSASDSRSSSSDSNDSNESPSVRFVDCADACLSSPFNVDCSRFLDGIDVGLGEDFCIVSYDAATDSATFSNKLPTNVLLFFDPELDGTTAKSLTIHASCSRALLGFGQTFGTGCDASGSSNVNLSNGQISESAIYIEFLDGLSTDYFDASEAFDSPSSYDISFAGCGCDCQETESPSTSPSIKSSISPTKVSSTSPSLLSSSTPTATLPSLPPSGLPVGGLAGTSQFPSQLSSSEPSVPRPLAPGGGRRTSLPTSEASEFVFPSTSPSKRHSDEPSLVPTASPAAGDEFVVPSTSPSKRHSDEPSLVPTASPAAGDEFVVPSTSPSKRHSDEPSVFPTASPAAGDEFVVPSTSPSKRHSDEPSLFPTASPAAGDEQSPSTDRPSSRPTTVVPDGPSAGPSLHQSSEPTGPRPIGPTANFGTFRPTAEAVEAASPSFSPSDQHVEDGSPSPSNRPSSLAESPSLSPTIEPTGPRPLGPARPPSAAALTDEECSTLCEEWVFQNCIRLGDNGAPLFGFACDASASELDGGGRFLGGSSVKSEDYEANIELLHELLLLIPK